MHAEIRQHTLYLSKAITMSTVNAKNHAQFCQLVSQPIDTIDLSNVSEADSACLALLIAALREKQQQKQPLHFSGMPKGLSMLADLYEVSTWVKS